MFVFLLLFIYALFHPLLISNSTRDSLILFATSILPSLFFYMLILDILFRTKPLSKVFFRLFNKKLSPSFSLILTSFLVGNPTNAKNITQMLENGEIDTTRANFLLATTHYTSLGFMISFVGSFLGNYKYSLLITFVSIFANSIIMLLWKTGNEIKKESEKYTSNMLSLSFANTANVLTMICLICVFGGILIDILLSFHFPKYLLGLIEITRGIMELNFDIKLTCALIGLFTSFGGLTIHMQIYAIIRSKMSYKSFLLSRIFASLITFIILYFI